MFPTRPAIAALLIAAAGTFAACDGTVATADRNPPPQPPGPPVLKLAGNLDAKVAIVPAWILDNWAGSSNFVVGLPAVSPPNETVLLFRRSDVGVWAWLAAEVGVPGDSTAPARPLMGGRLCFDEQGRLIEATLDQDADVTSPGGAPWILDFGSTYPAGSGTDGWVQTTAASFARRRDP
jgi:hypothetical protein